MKSLTPVALLLSLVNPGDAAQWMLAAQSAARPDYLGRCLIEYGGEGVAWMRAGDEDVRKNAWRVLGRHSIMSKCEGSLAWWVEIRPEDAARAREALAADPATRNAVRPPVGP